MKTTFKKTIDKFDTSYVNDESKIIEDLDISIDNITENVMQNISSAQKPRKKHKNITFMLIAAALTTAIVGTTVAAVALNKKDDFSEVISGESEALDVYMNDSFHFETTDDNLKAEFLGVKGTEKEAFALIELSTKDGNSFIGDYDGFISPEYTIFNNEKEYNQYIDLKKNGTEIGKGDSENNYRYWKKNAVIRNGELLLTKDNEIISGESNVYYVQGETSDKMKIYIKLNSDKSLLGTTVELNSYNYLLYNYGDVLAETEIINTVENPDTTINDIKEQLEKKGISFEAINVKKYNNYAIYYIIYDKESLGLYPSFWDTSDSVYKLRKSDLIKNRSLPFKASFTIDELTTDKTITLELNSKNAPNTLKNDETISIILTPLNAKTNTGENEVIFDTLEQVKDYGKKIGSSPSDGENCAEIILKNGNRYYFDILAEKREVYYIDGEEKYSFSWQNNSYYRSSKTPLINPEELIKSNNKTIPQATVIDPTNIDKIIFNGDTVYQAE